MRPFAEDIALELLKTIITSDTRKLVRVAEEDGQEPADLAVQIAFDYGELFVNEYTQRFHNTKKRKSR